MLLCGICIVLFFLVKQLLYVEEFFKLVFVQVCTDHTDTSGIISRAAAKLCLLRYQVKVEPLALCRSNDTLGTKHFSVLAALAMLVKDLLSARPL